APAPAASPPVVRDPLDRTTPRRAIVGFARAAQRGDLGLAARYAQVAGKPQRRAEAAVGDVARALDRYFHQPLTTISDLPEGTVSDGLALDRERVGPLRIAGQEHFIELVRVKDPQAGDIWLITADTLDRFTAVVEKEEGRNWPERVLPKPLLEQAFFDFTYADLLLWVASLVLPFVLLPPLTGLGRALMRRALPGRLGAIEAWYDATRWPGIVLLALAIHGAALSWYGPTLTFRIWYGRVLLALLAIVVAWGLHRALAVFFGRTGMHLQDRGRTGVRSVMMLGERLLNVLIVLMTVLVILSTLGFEMSTVLAGLGIVGVALALGAQKTIENILGGMMLLGDEAIAVGDVCRVNNRLGTVEDITLRSVRFRTFDQTLLSIPAGVLAQAEIENFATRDRFLAQHRLRLAYETTADQLRSIREQLAALIDAHPTLEHPLSRVRLVEFGPLGFELEIFAYVLVREMPRFLAVREELLLDAVTIVDAAGARFAEPAAWAAPAA
ncbi:MAG: mechanosensitive ion channel family protein, partial [Pseudacidovorax sp.]|nr:mechanosensitive ion channel family protein [Pseudacidovorax sp.]